MRPAIFRQMPHQLAHVGERPERHDRDQFRWGKGLLLRNAAGAQYDINPNAKSSYDLAADRPNMSLATPRKERG